MGQDYGAYDAFIDEHFDDFVVELREFCAQPALAGQKIGLARERRDGARKIRGRLAARSSSCRSPTARP